MRNAECGTTSATESRLSPVTSGPSESEGWHALGVGPQRKQKMLYMVIEHFRPGRAPDVYRRFRERGRMAPEGLRYVASWVDLDFTRCFQVMETDDEALLRMWVAEWQDLVDFEVVPVRTSTDAAALMAQNG